MNWFRARRLDYIDYRLTLAYEIRRADLVAAFGISVPQSSTDLNLFLKLYPGSMEYDKSKKCYRRCAGYRTRRGFTPLVKGAIVALRGARHPLGWS